jgi:hypothetical protein
MPNLGKNRGPLLYLPRAVLCFKVPFLLQNANESENPTTRF